MKKLLLLTAIMLLVFVNTNAQDIQFGIKGGLNFGTITGETTEDLDMVTAFNFGGMVEIPISEKFSLQPELLFSGTGFSLAGAEDVTALNYLNLPVMGKYYLTNGLSLQAGPQLGFLVSAKEEGENVSDFFNPIDFGVNVGLGYKLNNGLNFDARYNFGLTDISNSELNPYGFSGQNKNGVLQVSIGYFF